MDMKDFEKLPKDQQTQLLKKMEEIQKGQQVIADEDKTLKQLSMKEFEGKIQEMMKGYISRMTDVDRKYFQFPGIGAEGADERDTEAKFAKTCKFVKALVGGNLKVANEMHRDACVKANLSEGTTTAGGFLVPEEFKAEVLRLAPEYGVIRREARRIPMLYDVVNIPAAGTTDQSAIWTNEAAQIKQTNPDFRQVTLTINKLAAIPKVTNELLMDANVEVVQYLAELIAEAFAKEEDEQAFNGSGSPFVGCLQATGVPTSPLKAGTSVATLSYPDLVKATGDIYGNLLSNAKFYLNRSVISHIRSLITTAGAPIFGGNANAIVGFPMVSVEKLPIKANAVGAGTAFGVFGDLRRGMLMGERGSITMALSTQATVDSDNLFEKDMAALRMIERVCFGVALPSSFTRLVTAAS